VTDTQSIRLGLALGGGAIRGAAHLGVLDALEDQGIKPACISGTSIGAFVAALYAFGQTPQEILKLIRDLQLFDVAKLKFSKMGLLSHKQIGKLVVETIGDVNIEDAPIPLAIIATNVVSGQRHVFRKGSLAEAVLASTSVPGVFHPVILEDGQVLVDGGLVENVPVSPLRELGADCVIGVDLNGSPEYGAVEDAFDILLNAMDIALDNTTRLQLKQADAIIELTLSQFSRDDPKHIPDLYTAGYRGANKQMKKIQAAIDAAEPGPLDLLERKWKAWINRED